MFDTLKNRLREIFGLSLRYDCPKPHCGADLSRLELISGGIGRNAKGKIRGHFVIRCRQCGGRHEVNICGPNAAKLFMQIQGHRKSPSIKRQIRGAKNGK